ncbi:hypothetical protein ACIBTP_37055 [Streptomyces avidinii]|uniref:hypothetical protein n=1 Tax=Streptomyces avidinii TaxID=1895 RepID=UPI00379455D4
MVTIQNVGSGELLRWDTYRGEANVHEARTPDPRSTEWVLHPTDDPESFFLTLPIFVGSERQVYEAARYKDGIMLKFGKIDINQPDVTKAWRLVSWA